MEKKKRYRWVYIVVMIVMFGVVGWNAQNVQARGETVRIGVFELNGFYEKNAEGMPEGYGVDYLNKISEKTNWSYKYVWAENWDECINLLREGAVDMIAPAEKNAERMEEFAFSSFDIGMECGTLLALSTNEKLVYEDFEAFNSIQIGCVDSLIFKPAFLEYAQDNRFTPNIVSYRDTKALMAALNAGEVDAALVNLFMKTDTTKVLAKCGAAPFYYMMRYESTGLLQQLNEALQQIKIEFTNFESELIEQYYPAFNYVPFTKEELSYIQSAPIFRVGCRSDMKPVSYIDEETGEVAGITREILEEISSISGFRFEYAVLPEGNITYDYLRDNQISLIASVEYNAENVSAKGIRLSIPYMESKKAFVCRRETQFDSDKYMKLAVMTGSQTLVTVINEAYPNFEVKVYSSAEECFEAVRKGEADILLQNQYVIVPFLSKPIYENMVTIPVEGLEDKLCLSPIIYQKKNIADIVLSDVRLISILNKSIRQIEDQEVTKIIVKQTTERQYQYVLEDFLYQYRYFIIALGIIVIMLAAIICYTIRIRRKSMKIIMKNEAKLRNITNNINGGVVVLKARDGLRITYANEGFLELLQCSREEYEQMQEQEYITYIHPDDVEELNSVADMDMKKENQVSIRLRIMKKDGSYIPTLFNGTLTRNGKGETEIYCVIMDISEQERLIETISLEQKKYGILIQNSGNIIFEVDCKKKLFKVSPLFQEKFGWNIREGMLADDMNNILHLLRIHKDDFNNIEKSLRGVLKKKKSMEGMARLQKVDGSYLWCEISLYPMMDADEKLVYVIGKILDVHEEVCHREELEQKSRIDALTGILNKSAFFEEANAYLNSVPRGNTALVFIDMDNFKQINDKLGHMTGDLAIKETAKRLQVIFSNYDIISRFGGDEFCVLLKEIPEETLKDKLAWAVEKMKVTYSEKEERVRCSASIGAVCTYGRRMELDTLMECADKALYSAKENGKDQYIIYHEGM